MQHKTRSLSRVCLLSLLLNGGCRRDAMRQAVSYLGPQLPQQAALLGALSRWFQVCRCSRAAPCHAEVRCFWALALRVMDSDAVLRKALC